MKLVALIPTTGQRDIKYLIESLKNEVDEIEIYNNPVPIGVANARNELLNIVIEKYNREDVFLMIDDDAVVNPENGIRNASKLFDKDEEIGIINFHGPAKEELPHGIWKETIHCTHPFLIRGDVIFDNFKYTPDSYPDDFLFGLDVWLSGYKLIKVYKEDIRQHKSYYSNEMPCILSVVDPLYREGKLKLIDSMDKFTDDMFEWEYENYLGYNIIKPKSVLPKEKARELHSKNRWIKFNITPPINRRKNRKNRKNIKR